MRFPSSPRKINALADCYLSRYDDAPIEALVAPVRGRGHVSLEELEVVCRWKSPRALPRVRRNTAQDVKDLTHCALSSKNERLRIHSLLALDGVSWPTASVLLHWFHSDPYPLLDVRAIWSVGLEKPSSYSFAFWWAYVGKCRRLARDAGVSMRTLDRALWEFSKREDGRGSA